MTGVQTCALPICGAKKADWDVGIAVDAIRMASMFDIIIIVSGDGDFIPMVKYLQWGLGKGVEGAAFGKTSSSKLREVLDNFTDLDTSPHIIFRSTKSARKPKKQK